MRSVLGVIAAAFFAYLAVSFQPLGSYLAGDPGEIAGEPAVLAVMDAVRKLSIGFAIVSLAVIDWDPVLQPLRRMLLDSNPPADA